MRRIAALVLVGGFVGAAGAGAQSTGLPTYNAPYRAFDRHEAGFSVAFPGFDDTGVEALYRFGHGRFDIGLRGGIVFLDNAFVNDEVFVAGVEARQRVITHDDEFPADGAVVFGAGLQLGGLADVFIPSIGLSLGRRLEVEDSEVVIVPFVQPHAFYTVGDGNDELLFGLGFGADFRLSPRFDLRASLGVGDVDGLSVSAVWIR